MTFGTDRVILKDTVQSEIDADSALLSGELIWDGSILLDGKTLSLGNTSAELTRINGDLTLSSGSVLTVPVGKASPNALHTLRLEVTGEVTIDSSSSIDLTGKGYPSGRTGPNFDTSSVSGTDYCHGGNETRGSSDCTYGRYQRARFAGSGASAGGLLELTAPTLNLYGSIVVDGDEGGSSGAGGGVHLFVGTLNGNGLISASGGGGGSYRGSGGGRISLDVATNNFDGEVRARGGRRLSYETAGAGTVYWVPQPGQVHGDLLVSNDVSSPETKSGSTPIRNVGRRAITLIEEVSSGVWEVEVADTPWKATDTALDWGVQGIEVSLNADDANAPLYTVVSNTTNRLRIETQDDLGAYIGTDLIGVHTFNTVHVTGGASVTFGSDRVVLNGTGSVMDGELLSGELVP